MANTDEKFINDETVGTVWDKTKNYINSNTATVEGGLSIVLDKTVFGEPPYTLELTKEEQ